MLAIKLCRGAAWRPALKIDRPRAFLDNLFLSYEIRGESLLSREQSKTQRAPARVCGAPHTPTLGAIGREYKETTTCVHNPKWLRVLLERAAVHGPPSLLSREQSKTQRFSPSEFPFVTTINDDGKDGAGGWQEAKANLEFIKAIVPSSVTKWYCKFTIGMPPRPEMMGNISAKRAADLSVEITEDVARGMDYDLPAVTFCADFIIAARAAFKAKYPYLGSRVDK